MPLRFSRLRRGQTFLDAGNVYVKTAGNFAARTDPADHSVTKEYPQHAEVEPGPMLDEYLKDKANFDEAAAKYVTRAAAPPPSPEPQPAAPVETPAVVVKGRKEPELFPEPAPEPEPSLPSPPAPEPLTPTESSDAPVSVSVES